MHACVCLCLCAPRLLITDGVMWRDMDPYDSLNKSYSLCIAAVVGSLVGVTLQLKCVIETNLIIRS